VPGSALRCQARGARPRLEAVRVVRRPSSGVVGEAVNPPNRLERATSPYLRQHANNPVDWYPWGEEALARARDANRPILLSVGYSACHWCHVMAHESFEDAETARVMNAHFVSIKLDREERPDLDQLYQGVVQLMGRGGGWPLTVFLTPALEPFYGGTYFPPEDRYGIPGFKKLLLTLAEAYRTRPEEVREQAERFASGLRHLSTWGLDAPAGAFTVEDVRTAGAALAAELDPEHGGFGSAPKFPNPMDLALLLRAHRRGLEGARAGVLLALERMALGGIHDQLGGGFHRYSVDRRWRIPHFEKMLYDNAQLLHLYAEAELVEPRPLWGTVAERLVAWLQREMTAPSGAFHATQDADSEGEEGRFFTWTLEEMRAVLGAELADLAALHFGASVDGNFEHGRNVLEVRVPAPTLAERLGEPLEEVESRLDTVRARLFAAREGRVRPARDDKILAGWNGLMVRGLALAARAFRRPAWAELAARAATAVLESHWRDRTLFRLAGTDSPPGFLEDYGDLAAGLAAVAQATLDARWLEPALELVDVARERFWDKEAQVYLSAPRGTSDLLVPTYALHDNAVPSGASTLMEAQLALAALTGRAPLLEAALDSLRRLRGAMVRNPFAFGHLWQAADTALDGAAEVLLVGSRSAVEPLRRAMDSTWAPTVALAHVDPRQVPAVLAATAEGRREVEGRAAAYLCRRFSCGPPITDPGVLAAALEEVSDAVETPVT